jgi:hypothetical protein
MAVHNVEDHVELDGDDARSGQTGVHLRYVLIVSILLVLAGFGVAAVFN